MDTTASIYCQSVQNCTKLKEALNLNDKGLMELFSEFSKFSGQRALTRGRLSQPFLSWLKANYGDCIPNLF